MIIPQDEVRTADLFDFIVMHKKTLMNRFIYNDIFSNPYNDPQ